MNLVYLLFIFLFYHTSSSTQFSISNHLYLPSNSIFFHNVPLHPPNPIYEFEKEFEKDSSPNKVNLGIGNYHDEYGKPFVFQVVREIEKLMLDSKFVIEFYKEHNMTDKLPSDGLFDKDYLPQLGLKFLYDEVSRLILNNQKKKNVISFHTTSSTAAFGVILQFFQNFVNFSTIALSIPTYAEYEGLIKKVCPDKEISRYRYVERDEYEIDIDGMISDLKNLPDRSIVVLQSNCHNPTGIDPTIDQWKMIAHIFQTKSLFPLIDAAYLGFVSGDFEKDSEMIKLFKDLGIEFAVTVSFSKNQALYGERIGTGHIVTMDSNIVPNITSQIEEIVGEIYSSPPVHGARVAYFVFREKLNDWKLELVNVVDRIKGMRQRLVDELKKLKFPYSMDHVLKENGLFTFIELSDSQIQYLKEIHHIYIVQNGRINIAGLTESNVQKVAYGLYEAITTFS